MILGEQNKLILYMTLLSLGRQEPNRNSLQTEENAPMLPGTECSACVRRAEKTNGGNLE